MAYLLGVDLGTTFTAAAVASGGEPSMVGLGNRALQIPSVLFYSDDGFVVGEAAERRGLTEPDRVVREFKRRLGDHVPVLVAGSPFSADALMGELLSWVVAQVGARMGEAPAGLVLTHPASWGPFKLEALSQVAVLADVGPTQWCAEPAAAAAAYAARSRTAVGDRLAVYDLGGGTFDVCVLQKTDDGFVMLGPPEGVEHLGGADFDEAVFQLVLRGLGDTVAGADPDDPATTTGLARLRRDCVEAKEALSGEVEVAVPVALPGVATSVRVTRAEFEALIRPTLEQTVRALTRAVRFAGLTPDQLAGIVLVGGSSRIPLVGEMLQRAFGVPTAIDTHPKHDIVLGAVRLAQDRGAGADPTGGVTSRPVPMPIVRPGSPATPGVGSAQPAAPDAVPARPSAGPRVTAPRVAAQVTVPQVTAPPETVAPRVTASETVAPRATASDTAPPPTGAAPAVAARSGPGWRPSRRALVAAGAGLVLVAGAVGVGLAVTRSGDQAAPPLSVDPSGPGSSAPPSPPRRPGRPSRPCPGPPR